MSEPMDHVPLLNHAHSLEDIGKNLIAELTANADTDSDEKKQTVAAIKTLLELNAALVRNLISENLAMSDQFEKMLKVLEQK